MHTTHSPSHYWDASIGFENDQNPRSPEHPQNNTTRRPPLVFLIVATPNVMTSRRQPLMETSDNTPAGSPAPTSTARRSGRVTKAPEKFTPDAPAATKRKRTAEHDEEDVENESPDDGGDVDNHDDEDASDTAEEEPRRAKKKKSSQSKSKKPAAKKPKINGDAIVAEANHAPRQLVSRPKKAVRIAVASEGTGLYGAQTVYLFFFFLSLCCFYSLSHWFMLLTGLTLQPKSLPLEIAPTRLPRNGITSIRPTKLLLSPIL